MTDTPVLDRTLLIRAKAEPFDISGQSVIGTTADGTIVYWNESAVELYGWRVDDVLGRNVVDITPSAQTREQASAIMARLRTGETWSGDFMVRRRDGSQFRAEVRDVPVFDDTGELIGIIGISKAV